MSFYEYLYDKAFLAALDLVSIKTLYVKIVVLDIDDQPIESIEGKATSGSVNVNGNSSVRRTGSVALVADTNYYNITNVKNLISINKKIQLEVGIKNNTHFYQEYNIFWFPLGVYAIVNASVAHGANGINISLNLKDKMVYLNGECGGILPSSIIFSPLQVITGTDKIIYEPAKIRDIIYTLVSELGGIPKDKIIIEDIDDRIKNTVRWTQENVKAYLKTSISSDNIRSAILTTIPSNDKNVESFGSNESIGFINTDFTFPTDKELASGVGDSIVTVLDKLKNTLGNFEYFFDLDGVFHFQMIKNYLNEGSSFTDLKDAIRDKYLINTSQGKSLYHFNNQLEISCSNSPQFAQIKNDIMVWGRVPDTENILRYHLIIDKMPALERKYYLEVYTDSLGIKRLRKNENKEFAFSGANPVWQSYLYATLINSDSNVFYAKELIEEWPKVCDIETGELLEGINVNTIPYYFDILDIEELEEFNISTIGRRTKMIDDDSINCLFNPNFPDYVYIEKGQDDTADLRDEAINKGQRYVQVESQVYEKLAIGSARNSAYDLIRSILHELTSYNNSINISCTPIYHLEPNTRIAINDDKADVFGDYMIKTMSIPLTINGNMTIIATKAIERI